MATNARSFNGTSDIMSRTADTAFDPVGHLPLTVGFWAKPTTTGINQSVFSALNNTTANQGFVIGMSSGNVLQFTKAGVANVSAVTVDYTLNTWKFVAAVVNAGNTSVHFYSINESGTVVEEDVADASAINAGANQLAIGAKFANTTVQFWTGAIGWGGVWVGTALTDQQLHDFAGLSKSVAAGVTGWWDLSTGTPGTDQSGHSHTLTVTGTAQVAGPSPNWGTPPSSRHKAPSIYPSIAPSIAPSIK